MFSQLHNEEDNSESSAVEQPSTSNPTPHTVQAAPSASGHETESSPPPYSTITVEVPTTSGIVALSMELLVMFLRTHFLPVWFCIIIKSVNGLL